ncbi:MAG: hypothetical protein J7M38_08170, partial [Armatimonadetes bacterium]|nr:hypothetical protein [Armatimonadota bacterium]
AGVTEEEFFSVEPRLRYRFERDAIRYHDEHPEYEIFVDWHDFDHPQLGPVQIGGWKRFWLINPALDRLQERIAPGAAQFIIEYAARRPKLEISDVQVDSFGEVYRVRARVSNAGAFATNITQQALQLRSVRPVELEVSAGENARLLSRPRYHTIGHIPAYGRSQEYEWFVHAPAPAQIIIRASCDRGVDAEQVVHLGGDGPHTR